MEMAQLKIRNLYFDILNMWIGLPLSLLYRTFNFIWFEMIQFFLKLSSIWQSREFVNFTYILSDDSRSHLPYFLSRLLGCTVSEADAAVKEIESDSEIAAYYAESIRRSNRRWSSDEAFKPGRLLLHYALLRLTKPRTVFEAGLDKGFGAIIMNRALMKNINEGYRADYIGVEYRADRPAFLIESFPGRIGRVTYAAWGDEFARLEKGSVDFLFYDTLCNHEEIKKIQTFSDRLSDDAIIVSAWSGDLFYKVAEQIGRDVSVFPASSNRHWFSGSDLCVIHKRAKNGPQFQSRKSNSQP